MAQETKVEDKTCSIPMFERNNYFFGKPMTVGDFKLEQQYGIGKSRLLNRLIHGAGILCGMQVGNPRIEDGKFTIEISEGAALDCCGNLIVASKTDRIEVQGNLAEGPNYLYVIFSECVRQPIMAAANVSSCEEVCCYNRIRESFELVVDTTPPPHPEAGPSPRDTQTLDPTTLCDLSMYEAYASTKRDTQTLDPTTLCDSLTQAYSMEHLQQCNACKNPMVLLAVLVSGKEGVTVNETETNKYRSFAYNNPMLHDMLCNHLSDFNNPHRTTAEQVRALQSLNNVGNVTGKAYVSNINLVSKDTTIRVTANPDNDNQKVDLELAANAVKPVHLNNDTINSLLLSPDGTITIHPDTVNKRIEIKTNPAASVTSVAPAKVVGAATKYAPEDHVHDLANGVVTKPKLAGEVVNTLLASDGTIVITPDAGTKTITIATIPATDVSSVGPVKNPGISLSFARQDHMHNLNINEKGPNEKGQFLLTPGANVTIQGGAAANELVISATVSQAFRVTTGLVSFRTVREQEFRRSPFIKAEVDSKLFAIVMGLEAGEGNRVEIGDLAAESQKDSPPPLLLAVYSPSTGDGAFRIDLKDTRSVAQAANSVFVTYLVRWWAIPSTSELDTIDAPPPQPLPPIDIVRSRLLGAPGKTLDELAVDLHIEPLDLRPLIDQLKAEGSITERNGKLFAP